MTRSLAIAAAVLAFLVEQGACGGSTISVADGGAASSCGDRCSPSAIAASCASACDRIAQSGCSSTSSIACSKSCDSFSSTTQCSSLAADYLQCVVSAPIVCGATGGFQFTGCDSQQQSLQSCLGAAASSSGSSSSSGGTSSSGGSPTGTTCSPASVCPSIPRPSGGGAGICSGSGGGGPNGVVTSQTSCQDSSGNVWQASCVGSACTCTYNGGSSCTCTILPRGAACASCCPGTG